MTSARPSRRNGGTTPTPGRAAALKALRAVQERGAYASFAIDDQIESADLSDEDKRFASALTLGVVRTSGVLDEVLDGFLAKPKGINGDVRRALQIAAYELLFMDHAAHHAVDQGVRLVGSRASWARSMANAVLRRVASERERSDREPAGSELASSCRAHGFPLWLARQIAEDRSEAQARMLMAASDEQPPIYLHANSLKGDVGEIIAQLDAAGIASTRICAIPGCLKLARASDVAADAVRHLLEEGRAIVSDMASQLVALQCVCDRLPESILEVGAGRGTKTVLIQSMAHALWGRCIPEHVCVDDAPFKKDVLEARAALCGTPIESFVVADGRHVDDALSGRAFDVILIDAPCSGVGTLRRHPEIRWRLSSRDVRAMSGVQSDMLASAASLTRPGGKLIYATCTILRAEDEDVVDAFLAAPAGAPFSMEGGFQTLCTSDGPDAHFCAVLHRAAS